MRAALIFLVSICLTACGGGGSGSNSTPTPTNVPSTVVPAPTITSFSSLSATITSNETTTLTPVFSNGTASIDNGVGAVTTDAAIAVSPTATTTYTLTVTNAAGISVTSTLEVIVKPILTGYFTDSAVQGLNYATETQSGVTDALGAFTYVEGETISFTIGTFVLGDTVAAKAAMTPLDCTAPSLSLPTTNGELKLLNLKSRFVRPFGEGINFAKFQNLLVLLQSLDSDKDASNGITISSGMAALLDGVELDFEASPEGFRNALVFRKVMAAAVAADLINTGSIKRGNEALGHYYEAQEISTSFTTVSRSEYDSNADGTADDITTSTYDANGNELTKSTDNTGDGITNIIFTSTYDANGNMLTQSFDSNADGSLTWIRTLTYDASGNLLTQSEDQNADGSPNEITTFTYDANGNILTQSYDSNADGSLTWINTSTYDANGNGLTESFDSNADGSPDEITTNTYDANGNQLTNAYDSNADGSPTWIYTYTYDANGNKLTQSYDSNADGSPTWIYTYTNVETKISAL